MARSPRPNDGVRGRRARRQTLPSPAGLCRRMPPTPLLLLAPGFQTRSGRVALSQHTTRRQLKDRGEGGLRADQRRPRAGLRGHGLDLVHGVSATKGWGDIHFVTIHSRHRRRDASHSLKRQSGGRRSGSRGSAAPGRVPLGSWTLRCSALGPERRPCGRAGQSKAAAGTGRSRQTQTWLGKARQGP
jgi:hypothetical protein